MKWNGYAVSVLGDLAQSGEKPAGRRLGMNAGRTKSELGYTETQKKDNNSQETTGGRNAFLSMSDVKTLLPQIGFIFNMLVFLQPMS